MQNDYQDSNPPSYTKNQKIAVAVLAVFGVFIIILWMVQLKNRINAPVILSTEEDISQITSTDNATDESLKNKDTDKDGLSDWDELNTYKTSPYLPDSDGDGFSDKEEIKNGKDPNCPAGKICSTVSTSSDLSNSENNNEAAVSTQTQESTTSTATSTGSSALDSSLQNLDAASLRQLLIDSGMQKEMLDKFSDEELMKTYQNTLKSQ